MGTPPVIDGESLGAVNTVEQGVTDANHVQTMTSSACCTAGVTWTFPSVSCWQPMIKANSVPVCPPWRFSVISLSAADKPGTVPLQSRSLDASARL